MSDTTTVLMDRMINGLRFVALTKGNRGFVIVSNRTDDVSFNETAERAMREIVSHPVPSNWDPQKTMFGTANVILPDMSAQIRMTTLHREIKTYHELLEIFVAQDMCGPLYKI